MKMPNYIYLGPGAPSCRREVLLGDSAASPAAVTWSNDFVEALARQGNAVSVIYHVPKRLWPRGSLCCKGPHQRTLGGASAAGWYVNLPFIRDQMLVAAYARILKKTFSEGCADVLFTYNNSAENITSGLAAKTAGLRWVSIYADGARIGDRDGDIHLHAAGQPDLTMVFSYRYYEQLRQSRRCIYFPGGIRVRTLNLAPAPTVPRLVYTGSIDVTMGIDWLCRAMRLNRSKFELHVCGRGTTPAFAELVATDKRVVHHGLVSDERLGEICASAHTFLNPRPVELEENNYCFPSKLLAYLSYHRPIVSTMSPGLHPEFRGALIVPADASDAALSEAIDESLNLGSTKRSRILGQIDELGVKYSWDNMACRLMEELAK